MCNTCNNTCKCQQKTIKLEVGKTYLNRKGSKVTILEETNGIFCGKLHNPLFNIVYKSYHSDGRQGNWSYNTENTLVSEYHKPVAHKRDIVWFRYYEGGEVRTNTVPHGEPFGIHSKSIIILKRETVTYTEK